jgi:choline monooxygenase
VRHKEIIDRYDPELPLEQASTIPSSWYLNAELADLERHTVFARSWQFAGREEQVRNPGQYITCDIASQPIIVVRGQDNVLRAFFNVCLHHAAAVMSDPAGEASPLRCPYHGWTYTLDGHLKTTPDLGATCHFDRAAMTLKPVEVLIWKEWVFVRIERAGPPIPELSELTVAGFHWFERRHYLVDCNWKVFIDNYLDGGYHVPHIHKRLNSSLDYSAYQIELGERYCLQWSPYRGGERALYYWIYPNFMINRYPEAMDTNFVVPHGVSQT